MNSHIAYRSKLAGYVGVKDQQVFLFWKGRVALYSVLKAMGVGPGDEVILPAFTCVVVPNAILYLGAKPVYVDINPASLCCDPSTIEEAINPNTKVILIQNMLGLSYAVEEIIALAKQHSIYTVEDCTHGFGGKYNGVWNGLRSDASFFSSQWNKPFSTGIGGMLIVNNAALLPLVEKETQTLLKPRMKDWLVLRILLWARTYLLKGITYWALLRAYRWMSMKGVVIGSSSAEELQGITMPSDYFKGMSVVQCRAGMRALRTLDGQWEVRKKNALEVHQWLKGQGKIGIPDAFLENHAFLKYPLLVVDRERFISAAEKARLPLGDWFISPLHPIKGSLESWGLDVGKYPNAVHISKHLVNLPLEVSMPRLINFLELYKNEII
ncbi:MAG: DegT/DnrJ/EryC1/StrS family aminotransferase [Flavobacteriales bacterium]